jgi:hypothetical protein
MEVDRPAAEEAVLDLSARELLVQLRERSELPPCDVAHARDA